jgi:hypothetical protein
MHVLIRMPIDIYLGLIGRCPLDSREYALLRNAIIDRVQQAVGFRNLIEILCSPDDAKLMLDRARQFYPAASSYIAEVLNLSPPPPVVSVTQSQYRKLIDGDTWHFCSNCSKWPSNDFVATRELTGEAVTCNECIIRKNHGECDSPS